MYTITKIFNTSTTRVTNLSIENIFLNPLTGFILLSFGDKGFPDTFHFTWYKFITKVTPTATAKVGRQIIIILTIELLIIVLAIDVVNSPTNILSMFW